MPREGDGGGGGQEQKGQKKAGGGGEMGRHLLKLTLAQVLGLVYSNGSQPWRNTRSSKEC